MTHYALDSGAAAVILLDQGIPFTIRLILMILSTHLRIKILKKADWTGQILV